MIQGMCQHFCPGRTEYPVFLWIIPQAGQSLEMESFHKAASDGFRVARVRREGARLSKALAARTAHPGTSGAVDCLKARSGIVGKHNCVTVEK